RSGERHGRVRRVQGPHGGAAEHDRHAAWGKIPLPVALALLLVLLLCGASRAAEDCPADLSLARTYVGVLQQQRNDLEVAILRARMDLQAATQKLEEAQKPPATPAPASPAPPAPAPAK